jgi:hypothetical protein
MGSNVRHLTSLRHRGGKAAAVIAGAAVAMLCTGTAFAANMTSTPVPAAALRQMNAASRHDQSKPRTGGGRDAVLLGPGRRVAAGQLIPGRAVLDPVSVA